MVKLFVKNEKLYVEKAGAEINIDSATIEHHKSDGIYKIKAFIVDKAGNKSLNYTQKTYPLINIELKDTGRPHGIYKSYYNTSHRNYHINYYVI